MQLQRICDEVGRVQRKEPFCMHFIDIHCRALGLVKYIGISRLQYMTTFSVHGASLNVLMAQGSLVPKYWARLAMYLSAPRLNGLCAEANVQP